MNKAWGISIPQALKFLHEDPTWGSQKDVKKTAAMIQVDPSVSMFLVLSAYLRKALDLALPKIQAKYPQAKDLTTNSAQEGGVEVLLVQEGISSDPEFKLVWVDIRFDLMSKRLFIKVTVKKGPKEQSNETALDLRKAMAVSMTKISSVMANAILQSASWLGA
jgi:hypothetical protein